MGLHRVIIVHEDYMREIYIYVLAHVHYGDCNMIRYVALLF